MAALDDLTAEVGKLAASVTAAVAVLEKPAPNNDAALADLTAKLAAAQAALDAALAAKATPASS